MALDLDKLSPAELKTLIANAEQQIAAKRSETLNETRRKIEALLAAGGFSLADVFPTRGKAGKLPSVPKYRNPADPAQTWSGRGKRPDWFKTALKRGAKLDALLISGGPTASAKRAAVKVAKAPARKHAAPAKKRAVKKA